MAEERVQRRLAAILAADVVGYSRLMGEDEADTRARFNAHLHELIEPAIASRRGRTLRLEQQAAGGHTRHAAVKSGGIVR